jgi:Zn-dependent peptidase ImmA (M78 family)
LKYTEQGVPILNDSEIEERTYAFLSEYDELSLTTPMEAPIAGIFDNLKKKYKLTVIFNDLGTRNNSKILGKTIFSKNTIFIDSSIVYDRSPLFMFTSAHEIGHWHLHRKCKIMVGKTTLIDKLDDCEIDFQGKKKLTTPIDWIEHHANVFAASLLMPRNTFLQAVISIQKEMGISKNIGKFILNKEEYSRKDLDNIIDYLKNVFGTSKKSIFIRLEQLGILINETLIEEKGNGLIHIGKIFCKAKKKA